MVSELEGLLRGAAKIAAEETGTGIIHVVVNGENEYLLDTAAGTLQQTTGVGDDVAEELASTMEVSRARVHLTYASEDVFLGLAHKRTDPRAAMLTGKMSFRGEMALGIKLGYWIRKAAKQEEAAAEGGGLEGVQLEIAETDKWEKDEDTHVCAVCEQGFKVYRRRHHCRFCGRVVCQDCSSSKLGGQRACDVCRARADVALTRHQEAMALEEHASALEVRSGDNSQEEEEPVVAREIQSRLVQLEEEVDTLDKRSFATRARVLRQLVLMAYRLLVLALLALALLGAHTTASLLSRRLGPNLIEVTIGAARVAPVEKPSRSRLSAVVHGACDAAVHVAEVVTTSFDASAGAEEHGGYSGGCFRFKKKSPGTGESTKWPRRRRRRRRKPAAKPLAVSGTVPGEAAKVMGRSSEEEKEHDKEEREQQEKEEREEEEKGEARPAASPGGGGGGDGGLRLSLPLYWTVMALVVAYLRAHARRREGLIFRRVKTFCLAGTAIFALKMTKKLTQGMSPDESDDIWADMHKLLAPYMHQCILDVQGMWVKTGQYLSSRADVMPQPYIDELSKLQDAVPASPYDEVDETVKEQLGRPLTELFATIDREALASASVAQVHRCTLKDGRKAVIKVQHRRVRQLFLEDLKNIDRIVRVVAWADKDYDFRPIINEWASQSYKELDFVCEATNLVRIARAMRQSGLGVIIPELVPEFTRTKVVVMTFCEGFKVTDAEALAAAELDREGVMRKITESFAYQIHIDGLFNGDPHPGNILLQPQPAPSSPSSSGGTNGEGARSAMPVLLDWGLAKTLPENLRIAFSRFIYAGCEHDFTSMLVAFEEMGVKLNRFNPAEDMRSIRFLLRDTPQSAAESKEDTARFRKRMAKRRGRDLKNPVDAYPGDLLFFLRVHALLRGLATRLKVRQKYMDIMAPYAKRALREVVPLAERATQAVYPSPLLSPLEYKVRKMLEHLVETGQVTGCQVSVIYRGESLVDLCAGTQGPTDPRPVRPSTLFCVFSAGKAVCSTAVHLLADRGLLGYDQRLSELWPEFACNGKEATTVRHVLTHTTGLQHAFPDEATFDRICDWEGMQKVLVEAKPAWTPGSRASYHYFTFGWLVAAIVERASGVPFEKFVREQIAAPLGLEDSFYLGGLSARGVKPSRIAHVEHTFKAFKVPGRPANVPGHEEEKESMPAPAPAPGQSTQQASGSSSGGRGRETSRPTSSVGRGRESSRASSALVGREPSAESKQSVAGEDDVIGIEDVDEDVSEKGPPRLGLLAAMASTLKKADPEEGAAIDGLARKLAGREYFLDPRIFNYPALRDACIPAANGHFNAKALAVLYDNFLGSLGLSGSGSRNAASERRAGQPPPLLRRARVNEMRAYQVKETSSLHLLFGLPERGVRWSLGYQMFGFREPVLGPSSSTRGRVRLSGFGHVGLGGSVALCDPASGLAFAMVTNKVAGGRESSSAVLSLVCAELGIGDPSHFFED